MRLITKLLVVLLGLIVAVAALYLVASRVLGSDLVRRTLEEQLSARLGQPVRIAKASAAILPRVALDLHGVSVGAPAAITMGRIRIVTGLRPLLSRRVQDAEVILEDGAVSLPLPFDLLPAAPSAAGADAGAPLIVTSVRVIAIRGLQLAVGDQRWIAEAAGTLQGDRLEVSGLSAASAVSRLQGAGVLTSMARGEGQFTVSADPLDLDELIAFGAAFARPMPADVPADRKSAAMSTMQISVALTAAAGRFATHQFRDLSTTITMAAGALSLAPFTVSTFGGRFEGRLDADTRTPVPLMRLSGRIDDFDVADVLKAAGSDGGITGRLGGTVSLAAAGTDSEGLLRTARGSVTVAITRGTMPRLDLVRPIVLAFGKPSGAAPEGSGSAFTRLGGTFALANGVVSSTDLMMAARDFDLNGRGRVALRTGDLSAQGDVVLSRELTAQAGTDLRRYAQEEGRVIVPATVGGTLQHPAVTVDVAAAARRAIGNELQRRTRSFIGDLFKNRKQ